MIPIARIPIVPYNNPVHVVLLFCQAYCPGSFVTHHQIFIDSFQNKDVSDIRPHASFKPVNSTFSENAGVLTVKQDYLSVINFDVTIITLKFL